MKGWGGKQFTSSGKAVERIQIVADVNRVPKPTETDLGLRFIQKCDTSESCPEAVAESESPESC